MGLSLILIILVSLLAVWGLIAGIFKGFTKCKTSSAEFVLASLVCILIGKIIIGKMVNGASDNQKTVGGIIVIASVAVVICLVMLAFMLLKKYISKKVEKRKLLSYYKQYEEQQSNTEEILSAISTDDKKTYKKLSKRKFRQSAGGWGVTDRILGGVAGALRGLVIAGFMAIIIILVLEFSRLSAGSLKSFCDNLYASNIWLKFKGYIFDFVLIGILSMCIKSGYNSGISRSVWSLIMVALFIGAVFLSFSLAFKQEAFVSAAQSIGEGLTEKLGSLIDMLSIVGITGETLGKVILMILLLIPLLTMVILIGKFVPPVLDGAREGKIFSSIDGALGAIISTLIVFVLLLAFGSIFYSVSDLEFMNIFNAYFVSSDGNTISCVATFLYNNNLLNLFDIEIFNIHNLF